MAWNKRRRADQPTERQADETGGIPVPPFADLREAQRFQRMLQLFLNELKRPGQPIGLHQYVLAQVLECHTPRGGAACRSCEPPGHTYGCQTAGSQPDGGRACAQCGSPYPCRTVLGVAVSARFPVPWTPEAFVKALRSVRLLPPSDGDGDGILHLGGDGWVDPALTATRVPGRGWRMRSSERGSVDSWELSDDESLCAFLAARVSEHPYPYGWAVDDSWPPVVRPGARAAENWWTEQVALPYLETHRADGSFEGAGNGRSPGGEEVSPPGDR